MNDGFTKTEAALLEALERERALLRQRDLINGIVVHEMANAVTVVASTAELLRTTEPRSPVYQFSLTQLRGGVQALNEMIRGLRMLLDGEGDQPKFVRGDLTSFVRSVVTDPVLINEAAPHRVTLSSRHPPAHSFYCPTLLRHALGNLVRNALKYSAAENRVLVLVGARGEQQWVHVLNRGPRINRDIARQLFEPGKKHAKGGMGLGLHITRACALRMSAQLVFGSTNRATVFSLVLPIGEPDALPLAPAGATSES
jgi:signal transduction histidine kinase